MVFEIHLQISKELLGVTCQDGGKCVCSEPELQGSGFKVPDRQERRRCTGESCVIKEM